MSDRVLSAIDFVAWALLATGAFALLLGKDRSARVAAFLDRIGERLTPVQIRELAIGASVGSVGRIGIWMFAAVAVSWIVFDLVEIVRAIVLAHEDAPSDGQGLAGMLMRISAQYFGAHASPNPLAVFPWAAKVVVLTLAIPAFCAGAVITLRELRSPAATSEHEESGNRIVAAVFHYQVRARLPMKLLVAILGTLILLAFGLGMLAAALVVVLVASVMRLPLRGLAFLGNSARLKLVATALGIVLKIVVLVIKQLR